MAKPNKDGELEITDAGVSDKQFMALEAELSGLLKVMERAGNTISPVQEGVGMAATCRPLLGTMHSRPRPRTYQPSVTSR